MIESFYRIATAVAFGFIFRSTTEASPITTTVTEAVVTCEVVGCEKVELIEQTTTTHFREMLAPPVDGYLSHDGSEYAPPTVGAGFYAPCFADPNKTVADCAVTPVDAWLSTPGAALRVEWDESSVNFFQRRTPITCPIATPEPGTAPLIGSGLLALFLSSRKERTCQVSGKK